MEVAPRYQLLKHFFFLAHSQVVFIQYLTVESTPTGIKLRTGKTNDSSARHSSWHFRTLKCVVLLYCWLDSRARSGSKLVLAQSSGVVVVLGL